MNYIFLNLKRFEIVPEAGGVNSIARPEEWAEYIVSSINEEIKKRNDQAEFAVFFPEAYIMQASSSGLKRENLGCQGVYREDVSKGGNFGAFTSCRSAKSMAALGCGYTIIGHCEERRNLKQIVSIGGGSKLDAINSILNSEILRAQEASMKVLYCIGEDIDEVPIREKVLRTQLEMGLEGCDLSNVVIGYEPLWAIGPGRPVPTADEMESVASLCKSIADCPVVYGGGLKKDNADMIASVKSIDGGLIALTRFSGDIGFYPEEYIEITEKYLAKKNKHNK